jgi:hypothetical protein
MRVGEYAARYGAYEPVLVSTKIALLTELAAVTGAVQNRRIAGAARGHHGRWARPRGLAAPKSLAAGGDYGVEMRCGTVKDGDMGSRDQPALPPEKLNL